ncbi:hypothetical protein F5884DRAFT_174432 [Xylogone sp. PMI_703]|nr:hypothetical protein F5884DRAFT_174432 [Xylogone sp. PMI_703]
MHSPLTKALILSLLGLAAADTATMRLFKSNDCSGSPFETAKVGNTNQQNDAHTAIDEFNSASVGDVGQNLFGKNTKGFLCQGTCSDFITFDLTNKANCHTFTGNLFGIQQF